MLAFAALALHFAVSTTDPAARADFERGLFLTYAYDRVDARAAFEDAARSDPSFAMAYWGEALACGPNLNRHMSETGFACGARAMAASRSLESAATPRERSYIDALSTRFEGDFPNAGDRAIDYREAMLARAQTYPEDDDAQLLAAEAALETTGLRWQGSAPAQPPEVTALRLVTTVLARDPENAMANHLCVHLYDDAPDRTPAIPCARRLDAMQLPPQAEHLAHMAAHLWIDRGDYRRAVASSERAYALIQQLEPTGPHRAFYERHDVYVGFSAALMQLDPAVALRWCARADATLGENFDAQTKNRYGLVAAPPEEADTPRNRAALTSLAQEQHAVTGDELIALFPAEERLGGMELSGGHPRAAETAFRGALSRYRNDPWALFGLQRALQERGQAAQARAIGERLAALGDASFLHVGDL